MADMIWGDRKVREVVDSTRFAFVAFSVKAGKLHPDKVCSQVGLAEMYFV